MRRAAAAVACAGALVATVAGGSWLTAHAVEDALCERVGAEAGTEVTVSCDGRDVSLAGTEAAVSAAVEPVTAVPGVRRVLPMRQPVAAPSPPTPTPSPTRTPSPTSTPSSSPVASPTPEPVAEPDWPVVTHFAGGSAAVAEGEKGQLRDLADYLESQPEAVVVVTGHTDSGLDEGRRQALGLARTEAVEEFLAARGVDPARFRTGSAGMHEPVAGNDTLTGRAANRRVEIRIEGNG
ncbi:MAG: OmpA family protein [Propioniciclava sp.]